LLLTPPDRRDSVRLAQELELAEDVKKAADRADANEAMIQAEDTQVFYSRNGRLLKIGALSVMDRYQPDANVELFKDMTIEGDLQPGSLVKLTYQIMPGQSDTVQGIALSVVAPPVITPTPEVPAAPAVDVQPREVGCTVTQPEGWVEYNVASGDNLTWIAKRGGTTVEEIMQINCLDSETILIGARLYVPPAAIETSGAPVTDACVVSPPENWVSYQVQVGDNLTVLADYADVSVEELMRVNCLDSETILIGQKLFLPPAELITP
jgi:LysM repeat protein